MATSGAGGRGHFVGHGHVDSEGEAGTAGLGAPGPGAHALGVGPPDARYLSVALLLIVGFMVIEVTAAAISGSLALLADAGHMLTDAGALGVSLWAARLSARPASGAWTYGFKRAEILSAAGNGITLLIVAALVTFESVRRLMHPATVEGGLVIVVALVGVAVNLTAAHVLLRASRSSLNVEGSFRHILTDIYGFGATLIAGIVIVTTGFGRADAIAAAVVVVLMLKAAYALLKASGRVLLEAAPEGVDLEDVRAHLLEALHVTDIHDLHAWTVTSGLPALSAHVVVEETCFLGGHAPQLLDCLQACLAGHFDLGHSTFQLEVAGHVEHERGIH